MKTRPLCYACLFFLLMQSIRLLLTGGGTLSEIPASSVFREGEGKSVAGQGQVYDKSHTSNSQVLYLKNNSIAYQNHLYDEPKMIVYVEKEREIPIGKTVCLSGTTVCFSSARNPGGFDTALYYARQGLYGAVSCKEIEEIGGKTQKLAEGLYQCKVRWKNNLLEVMGEDTGGILAAMILGEKSEMDVVVKEQYQAIGIGHILAISGLHISFIGLGIYALLRKAGLPFLPAGAFALGILSLYVLMIGWSVSVLRAFVMLLLRIGGDVSGRVYDRLTALLFSAAITIGYQPLYLTDGGFYMSYGAILGILLLLPVLERCFWCRWKWLSGVYASLSINLMLFPVLLWFYFEFPTYSLFWNFLVIPMTSPLMGFGMLGSLFLVIAEPLGVFCLKICDWLLQLFGWMGQIGSELPASRLVLGRPTFWKLIVYYVLIFGMLLWSQRWRAQGSWKRRRGYLALTFVVAIFLVAYRPNQDLTITMLDVGQGDAIFLEGPTGTTYLIDGGSSDKKQLAKYDLEPFLKSQGVGELDYVFVTHGDTDHCSGIVEMLERQTVGVKIETLVLPVNFRQDETLLALAKAARSVGVDVALISATGELTEGELSITCLQPARGEQKLTGNAGSLVLEVRFGAFSMLCTGDVEAEGEKALLQKVRGMDMDVLKVAHHGSKYSTSEDFLGEVKPEIALVSAGKGNSYGHPHEETLQRLRQAGCEIFQTVESGAVTIHTDGKKFRLITAKD